MLIYPESALSMPPMIPPQVPTYWSVYFAVDDCDATTAATEAAPRFLATL